MQPRDSASYKRTMLNLVPQVTAQIYNSILAHTVYYIAAYTYIYSYVRLTANPGWTATCTVQFS